MRIYDANEVAKGQVTRPDAFNKVADLLADYVEQNPDSGLVGGMFFGSIFTKPMPGSDLNCALVFDRSKAQGISGIVKNLNQIALQNGVYLNLHMVARNPNGDVYRRSIPEVTLWEALCFSSEIYRPFLGKKVFTPNQDVPVLDGQRLMFVQYLESFRLRYLPELQSFNSFEDEYKNSVIGEMISTCHVLLKLFLIASKLLDHTASKKEVYEAGKAYFSRNKNLLDAIVKLVEITTGYLKALLDFSEEPTSQEKRLRYTETLSVLREKTCPLVLAVSKELANEDV